MGDIGSGGGMKASLTIDDQRLEVLIGGMLRVGVSVSALVVLAGGILYLMRGGAAPDYTHFHSAPKEALSIGGTFWGVVHGSAVSIIQLGILLLIATPVVRVIFALVGFLLQRDKLYVLVSAVVLAILLFSLVNSR
jgi:uncharacterized membrane protein